MSTAAVGRFDRSRGRSIESIGSVGSVILQIFRFFCHVGELEICLVSKFQLCTTLGGRKNAEKPKRKFSEFFGSVGSVFRSVRSILRPRVVVDRSGEVGTMFGQLTVPKTDTKLRTLGNAVILESEQEFPSLKQRFVEYGHFTN